MTQPRTRQEVQAHILTIRPQALKFALETRETIQMTQCICGDKVRGQVAELRRTTLDMIASAKRQEALYRQRLESGLYDD